MPRTEPFDKYLDEYEQWFEEYRFVYESELEAVKQFIPKNGKGIEIGIGTGRFAIPFGIKEGVEASCVMRHFAMHKGLEVYQGIAEELPLSEETYDFVLMVTTICFIDNIKKALREVRRILKPGGNFTIGLVDRNSLLGKTYEDIKDQNKFYRYATFYSTDEVKKLLEENRFRNIEVIQTVFGELPDIHSLQQFKKGYGEGGFIVINATKVVEK